MSDPAKWQEQGRCHVNGRSAEETAKVQSLFFPDQGGKNNGAKAKAFCYRCDIREECLEYALLNRIPFGIWGGMNERERRVVLKRRGGIRAIRAEAGMAKAAKAS